MESLKLHLCLLLFFVSNSILIPSLAIGDTCLPRKHAALFVFGDSLFDVGNNNYINTTSDNLANYPPYGETFFKYPSGRFSNGRLIPDFIAEYAKLPLIQPYLFPGYKQYTDGINFASSGAGALVETHQGIVIDLNTQLSYFKIVSNTLKQKLGKAEAKTLLAKAFYLFNIGGNDYSVFMTENSSVSTSYTPKKYVDMVVGNLTNVIKGIYKIGGRKFGFLNQPPFGCLLSIKALENGTESSCLEEASSSLAKLHNSVLSVETQKLEKKLKGFKYSYFDYFDISFQVINHPSKYGFKESDVACCGSGPNREYYSCGGKRAVKDYELCENPSEYVFFDSVHPTERVYQLFSQLMWSGNQSITGPHNLKTLFEE
ncbi:putative carboxylesterase [Lupinus albus]|uniref:Putative carboxylesterase n=1 Tax=Lupinus albus TaxID=3870 RepID=A0A6A4QR26_LUPAL|nr:putative carboxylesterase [Lupinus albus]